MIQVIKEITFHFDFSQFLKDNFDYNEVKALDLFAECGLYDTLFDVARVRGMIHHLFNSVHFVMKRATSLINNTTCKETFVYVIQHIERWDFATVIFLRYR